MANPAWTRATARISGMVAAVLLAGGCLLSSEPFYSQSAVTAPLVGDGRWQRLDRDGEPEQGETWTFDGSRVTAMDDRGHWYAFEATWFRLGDRTFVDTRPVQREGEPSAGEAYWQFHHPPFHMVSRVEFDGEQLRLRPLTFKAFEDAARGTDMASAGVVRRDGAIMVFGANAQRWSAFLERHGGDEAVFTKNSEIVFVRR